jgi:hypothetical protein
MSFEWIKKDKLEKFIEIRRGREPNTGYDNRFQIQKRKADQALALLCATTYITWCNIFKSRILLDGRRHHI